MTTEQQGVTSSGETPSASQEEESLSERFANICATTPPPKYQRAHLPGATEEELQYLVQNDSGEIFMSPDAIWSNNENTHPAIMAAMFRAMRHACEGYDVDIFPPGSDKQEKEEAEKKEQDEEDVEDESGERPTFCSVLGIPDFKPIPELRTLTWANSEAKKVIDAFNEETERIRAERAAKEAAEEAALMAKVPQASKKAPEKPPGTNDLILWAAQEEAAASSVMRDLRARSKKSLWGSKSTKLRPEAAAEMARARVAAEAAKAVMRNESRGAELVRAETIDSSDFLERFVKGKQDEGGFYPMHAQAFQKAMSLDSGPRGKKKVAFAADTVFSKNK